MVLAWFAFEVPAAKIRRASVERIIDAPGEATRCDVLTVADPLWLAKVGRRLLVIGVIMKSRGGAEELEVPGVAPFRVAQVLAADARSRQQDGTTS